jgi:hypothetical protein
MRTEERNFMRGTDKEMRIKKESSNFNSVNQHIPKINKVE